jgi:hypothetical protein
MTAIMVFTEDMREKELAAWQMQLVMVSPHEPKL